MFRCIVHGFWNVFRGNKYHMQPDIQPGIKYCFPRPKVFLNVMIGPDSGEG